MPITKNAIYLLNQRYCHPGEKPKDVYKRVANALALGDDKFEKQLYDAMFRQYFLPNSPCLRNAGIKKGMLHACFVIPIHDNTESIFDTLKHMGIIFHFGGGVGINFSELRPNNAPLSTGGTSSGAISFMRIFNTVTETVKQGGFRRGALMGVLNHDHAEIIDFVRVKLKDELTNFNISVLVTDDFMKKVINGDGTLELKNPQNGETWSTIHAKDLFDTICFSAWNSGDPGMLFYNKINDRSEKSKKMFPKIDIKCTNPCGETPLPDYGACCLGSINLSKFVKKNGFDTKNFRKYLKIATRALLNNNAISWYPMPEITKTMKELNPIGVGLMGFADCLIKLGIYYDSDECLAFIDEIGAIYKDVTEKIAKNSFYKRIIAPTGSLSILADCSSGIEPVFAVDFERHLTIGILSETREIYKSKYTRTAHEIKPLWHLKVQAQWQKWLDGSISKTINLPYEASVDDIKDIYLNAYKMGCKGITVFRDGCKQGVLRVKPVVEGKCDGEECHL